MRSRPGGTNPTQDRAWLQGRGLGSKRLRVTAFGLSIAVHLVGIVVYSSVVRLIRPDAASFPMPSDAGSEQGLEVIRLMDLEELPDPQRPDDPQRIEEVTPAEAEVRPPFIDGPVVGELPPPGPSPAERLRPNQTDPRLWAEPPPEFYELTLEQREELMLSTRIVEWYDSIAAARGLDERMTDWTFRDADGGRWGIADGKIYLGDISLPLPIEFGIPVGRRDEIARRMWQFDEIERQSQRYLIEESWAERAAATRARRDRERAAARDTIGS